KHHGLRFCNRCQNEQDSKKVLAGELEEPSRFLSPVHPSVSAETLVSGFGDLVLVAPGHRSVASTVCHRVSANQPSRWASSASSARSRRYAKNSCDWPMKSPSAVKALRAPIAAPFVAVGRMIEHAGSCLLRNTVGSGMIRLVWKSSPPNGEEFRSGKVTFTPVTGSTTSGSCGALPALSCQVWKCAISVPPMLSRIRKTSTLLTRWASMG